MFQLKIHGEMVVQLLLPKVEIGTTFAKNFSRAPSLMPKCFSAGATLFHRSFAQAPSVAQVESLRMASTTAADDPFIWLEEVNGEKCLAWAKDHI